MECTTPSRWSTCSRTVSAKAARSSSDVTSRRTTGAGQPAGDQLGQPQLAPEGGQHYLGTLLLGQAGDMEGDGRLGQHTGDEDLLAVEQGHCQSVRWAAVAA